MRWPAQLLSIHDPDEGAAPLRKLVVKEEFRPAAAEAEDGRLVSTSPLLNEYCAAAACEFEAKEERSFDRALAEAGM